MSGESGMSGVPGESVMSKSSVSSMSSEFIVSGQCIVCLMLLMLYNLLYSLQFRTLCHYYSSKVLLMFKCIIIVL